MKNGFLVCCISLFSLSVSFSQIPKPTPTQTAWHNQEFYLFFHFGPNTFTGKEWGHGDEKEAVFNPSELDTDQWCRIAKTAGAKGVIITAKHHDGFCLWPSKYSTHTVAQSPWRNGKGDVLKDLSESCKKFGLKFGVYISPWDRNHPAYGTPAYNEVYINTMKEIFANYGPIWELWWDGANGEGPNGKKQVYDFKAFEKTIREISPETVIFSDIGPDLRWVGNEQGFAGETNWNMLDTAGFKRGAGGPPTDTLNRGNVFGKNWIPAECDVSIRPGWFYHKEEDEKVKTGEQLFELYLKSVGRGANLLLNVPPDTRGLIHENDSASLMDFFIMRNLLKTNEALPAKISVVNDGRKKKAPELQDGKIETYKRFNSNTSEMNLRFKKPRLVNCIALQEFLNEGQSCSSFRLVFKNEKGEPIKEIKGTTIGHKRLLTFLPVTIQSVSLIIDEQRFETSVGEFNAFYILKN